MVINICLMAMIIGSYYYVFEAVQNVENITKHVLTVSEEKGPHPFISNGDKEHFTHEAKGSNGDNLAFDTPSETDLKVQKNTERLYKSTLSPERNT